VIFVGCIGASFARDGQVVALHLGDAEASPPERPKNSPRLGWCVVKEDTPRWAAWGMREVTDFL